MGNDGFGFCEEFSYLCLGLEGVPLCQERRE